MDLAVRALTIAICLVGLACASVSSTNTGQLRSHLPATESGVSLRYLPIPPCGAGVPDCLTSKRSSAR